MQAHAGPALRKFAEEGMLTPLDDLAAEGKWKDVMPPLLYNALSYKGAVFAVVEAAWLRPLPFPEPVLASSPGAPAAAARMKVPPGAIPKPAQSVGAVSGVAPRG